MSNRSLHCTCKFPNASNQGCMTYCFVILLCDRDSVCLWFSRRGGGRGPQDVGCELAERVSYLTDPVRAYGGAPVVRLTQCGFVAAYVLAVAGCVALRCDPWSAAQSSALRPSQPNRVLRHLQRDALSAAVTLHGHADHSEFSLSADMPRSSASQMLSNCCCRPCGC